DEPFASTRPSALPREAPFPVPAPGGQVEPARLSATHPAVPPDASFPTSPLLGGCSPVPVATPGQGPLPATPGASAPPPSNAPAAPQTITLPTGEVIPVDTRALSKSDPIARPGSTKKKPIQVDPALLEKILIGKVR